MSEYILETVDIQKSFPSPSGSIEVLRSVSMAVKPGESVSIRGESGAGKSTYLSILAGLDSAQAGTLYWRGESVLDKGLTWQAKERADFFGMVFQAYYLIPELNALENVLMAARIVGSLNARKRERAEQLLVRVGLKDRIKHLSTQLSGGERQRVAIARAMMNEPQLILADEPTGNLDEATGEHVMSILLELCCEEKSSLVLVTHNPDFAEQTDRALFLRGGQMEEMAQNKN